MHWIMTLVVGGVVGWLASIVMKTNAQMGWIANVVVGVVGSLLGYWLAGLIGIVATNVVLRLVIAVASSPRAKQVCNGCLSQRGAQSLTDIRPASGNCRSHKCEFDRFGPIVTGADAGRAKAWP